MTNDTYPRDLVGYGREVPFADWPNGAHLAVQFVLNYEEGGESCILDGDPASESLLSEIVGAQPWPEQRNLNMESLYEYGSRAGFWRLWRMFTERGMTLTVYGVALAMARNPEAVAAMKEADWEIASHGLRWLEYKDFSEEEERRHIAECVRLHTEVTGSRPLGIYQGKPSANTLNLVMEEGGFVYSADSYADELPYYVEGPEGPHLIVPYTLDANDMRFATPQGFNSGDQFYAYLRDTFDALYAEGSAGQAKMMSVGLHCRLIGRPGRIQALKRFIDYIKGFEGVWTPRRIDIAEHWRVTHPPQPRLRLDQMDRASFVAKFGGVFEHSAWIAERAYELELGPAHNSVAGIHNALARMFRSATRAERLGVLTAHPDLAGKLAAAKRLTAESTQEQASAGLDALTDAERARFETLNSQYVAKHGFPFIIAVKDHDKDGILRQFETRIANATEDEFTTACAQVERIARLRLEDML